MKRFGSELNFISRISGDGQKLDKDIKRIKYREKDIFNLNRLSISNNTYIASGFNSYVVRLKNPPPTD